MSPRKGPVQKGHNLRPGAGSRWRECGGTCATGNPICHSPANRWRIIVSDFYIGKCTSCARCRRAGISIQEHHRLSACYDGIRTERRGARSTGNPLLHSPQYSIVVICGGAYIPEWIGAALRCRASGCGSACGRPVTCRFSIFEY